MKDNSNKSPLQFFSAAVSALGGGGGSGKSSGSLLGWDGKGGISGMTSYMRQQQAAPAPAAPAPVDPRVAAMNATASAGIDASGQAAPGDGSSPFEGKTFTISPAQQRAAEGVYGSTEERQASVGSPLAKKSCGKY